MAYRLCFLAFGSVSLSSLFSGVLTQTFAWLTSVSPVCCQSMWLWCAHGSTSYRKSEEVEQEVELEMEIVDCL